MSIETRSEPVSGNASAGKNIVLCSDGTGNSGNKERGTNVFKLYEAVDIQRSRRDPAARRQVAFYDDGVGTQSALPLKILGGALGWGFCKNIRDLYTELVHVYEPGDWLYLFGFSRGAYTVRSLAGMIQYCGIIDVRRDAKLASKAGLDAQVDRCWKEFYAAAFTTEWDYERVSRLPPDRASEAARKASDAVTAERRRRLCAHAPDDPVRIRFLGVWDTVGAVGMPVDELKFITDLIWPSRFKDLTPGREIERACHALAIDDERRTFWPELWNEAGARDGQLEQVWFAGVHSNVGGGYSKHGMSLVALDWMMAEAEAQDLQFIPADREYGRTHQDVHDKLHDSRAGFGLYYRWKPRDIARICAQHRIHRPKIHVSVFERIAMGTNAYCPGNLPAALSIVGTRGWPRPTSAQMDDTGRTVEARLGAEGASSLLGLADVRRWVRVGQFSYFGFLVLTLAALAVALHRSVAADLGFAATLWAMSKQLAAGVLLAAGSPLAAFEALWPSLGGVVFSWWFLPGMALCYFVARRVDARMELRFSNFWHACRADLRALLDLSARPGPGASAREPRD